LASFSGLQESLREDFKTAFPQLFISKGTSLNSAKNVEEIVLSAKRSGDPLASSPIVKKRKVEQVEKEIKQEVSSPLNVQVVPVSSPSSSSVTGSSTPESLLSANPQKVFDEFKALGLHPVLLGELQEVYSAGINLHNEGKEVGLVNQLINRAVAIIHNLGNHLLVLKSPFLEHTCKAVARGLSTHFSFGAFEKSDALDAITTFRPDPRLNLSPAHVIQMKANIFSLIRSHEENFGWHLLQICLSVPSEGVNLDYLYSQYLKCSGKARNVSDVDVLLDDLDLCREFCYGQLHHLISQILRSSTLSKLLLLCPRFLKLMVSSSSPSQISDFCEMLERRDFVLFPLEGLKSAELMFESISWDGFDQTLLWQLFASQFLHFSAKESSQFVISLLNLLSHNSSDRKNFLC
jgi:hypothetical protein